MFWYIFAIWYISQKTNWNKSTKAFAIFIILVIFFCGINIDDVDNKVDAGAVEEVSGEILKNEITDKDDDNKNLDLVEKNIDNKRDSENLENEDNNEKNIILADDVVEKIIKEDQENNASADRKEITEDVEGVEIIKKDDTKIETGNPEKYICNCKKICPNLDFYEAQYQLKVCGCKVRDRDKDGVACEKD